MTGKVSLPIGLVTKRHVTVVSPQAIEKGGVGLIDLPHCDVHFLQQDALSVAERFADGQVDFLHVDLSNDGDSLRRTMEVWHPKLRPGGMLLFEGGSAQRDQISWMQEFDKVPIARFLNSPWFQQHYSHTVIEPFPSLTIATKR
jgi:hypothetical protein